MLMNWNTKFYFIVRISFCVYLMVKLKGSFADNLKISKPDEFDLVMRLKFPKNELVKIKPDVLYKGNVFIDLTEVLKHLKVMQNEKMLKFLLAMVDENFYFLQNKFQRWLEGCFTKYLLRIDRALCYNSTRCRLLYRKQGPAHTIDVYNGMVTKQFSIDFVPGFRFEVSASVCPRRPNAGPWEAIPKPIKGVTGDNPSFRTSYTESERKILANKNQLKNALRLMKKFRDATKLNRLSSYYIKTLFLWHDEKVDSLFWNQPTAVIINEMFQVLETALLDQKINFFWDKRANLLKDLSAHQVNNMYHAVKNARRTLMAPKCANDIIKLFVPIEYQSKLTADDIEVIEEGCIEKVMPAAKTVALGALGAAVLYGIYKYFTSEPEPNEEED